MSVHTFAQKASELSFELGNGLTFDYDDGNYVFNIGGFMQPYFQYQQLNDASTFNRLSVRNAFITLSEKAKKEKMGFVLRANFAESFPLMDAYITYEPWDFLTLSFGQRQNFGNNRELLFLENKLRFGQRNIISTSFAETGREFGVFAEGEFSFNDFTIKPQVAITSGDGRNSFGSSSTDIDKGGMRYAGRLDIYPLGLFTKGNDEIAADFVKEDKLKILIGAAYSVNYGASNRVGEGHGDFFFYDENLNEALPNYWKQYFDILIKWKGISLMGEFVNSSADGLTGLYIDPSAVTHLQNGEISEFLSVGQGYNIELGYVLPKDFAIDVSYGRITPEFADESDSILKDTESYTIGLSKFVIDNRFKVQANYSVLSNPILSASQNTAEVIVQIVF